MLDLLPVDPTMIIKTLAETSFKTRSKKRVNMKHQDYQILSQNNKQKKQMKKLRSSNLMVMLLWGKLKLIAKAKRMILQFLIRFVKIQVVCKRRVVL